MILVLQPRVSKLGSRWSGERFLVHGHQQQGLPWPFLLFLLEISLCTQWPTKLISEDPQPLRLAFALRIMLIAKSFCEQYCRVWSMPMDFSLSDFCITFQNLELLHIKRKQICNISKVYQV